MASVVCKCGEHTWEYDSEKIEESYTELRKLYDTVDEFEDHVRVCDYCGAGFVTGFTVDGGGWYCCEDCFPHVVIGDNMIEFDQLPDDDKKRFDKDEDYWFEFNIYGDGKWECNGVFYTEWW